MSPSHPWSRAFANEMGLSHQSGWLPLVGAFSPKNSHKTVNGGDLEKVARNTYNSLGTQGNPATRMVHFLASARTLDPLRHGRLFADSHTDLAVSVLKGAPSPAETRASSGAGQVLKERPHLFSIASRILGDDLGATITGPT